MSVDEDTPNQESNPRDRKGFFASIYDFFDSKIGLAVLTFLLTGGLGTLATWLVTDIQHRQAVETVALQARAAELGSLHNGIEAAILEREIATESYTKAIEVGAGDSEIEQLWQKYEDAVQSETLLALQSHLVITGHTQDGPDPGQLEGKSWVFWTYLSNVIQPRFASMHDCLLGVHNAYVNAELPLENRLGKARAELKGCLTDKDWDKYSYTYTRSNSANGQKGAVKIKAVASIAEWDDFKACLEDLHLSSRHEREAGSTCRAGWTLLFTGADAWGGCAADDDTCRQKAFLDTVPIVLPQSCGGIDNSFN